MGFHSYSHVGGATFFGDDPGVSGSAPYVGARLRLAYAFTATKSITIAPGLEVFADDDLARENVTATFSSKSLFGSGTSTATDTHTVGTFTAGGGLTLGFTLSGDPFPPPAPRAPARE